MAELTVSKVDKDTGKITGTINLEVRAYPIAEPKGATKGYASVTVDGMFGAHGISIVEGKNGLFVAMPQTKDAKGEYRDIFHPVTREAREALNGAVLSEFAAALGAKDVQKDSTLNKIRESAKETKGKAAPVSAKGTRSRKKAEAEI